MRRTVRAEKKLAAKGSLKAPRNDWAMVTEGSL
jgi:hypothetical protein